MVHMTHEQSTKTHLPQAAAGPRLKLGALDGVVKLLLLSLARLLNSCWGSLTTSCCESPDVYSCALKMVGKTFRFQNVAVSFELIHYTCTSLHLTYPLSFSIYFSLKCCFMFCVYPNSSSYRARCIRYLRAQTCHSLLFCNLILDPDFGG